MYSQFPVVTNRKFAKEVFEVKNPCYFMFPTLAIGQVY